MRARAVGGVDAVDPALEDARALVDVLGVGAVGRVQFGGDGELAAPQHPLQPAARGMAGQVDQRRAGIGADVVGMRLVSSRPRFARTTRSQDDEPFRRWSIAGCTSLICSPRCMRRLPS